MRMILIAPLLALGACQVTEENNGAMTVEYNQDVAEEGVRDAANVAENVADTIGNEAEQTADKIENKVDDGDAPASNAN